MPPKEPHDLDLDLSLAGAVWQPIADLLSFDPIPRSAMEPNHHSVCHRIGDDGVVGRRADRSGERRSEYRHATGSHVDQLAGDSANKFPVCCVWCSSERVPSRVPSGIVHGRAVSKQRFSGNCRDQHTGSSQYLGCHLASWPHQRSDGEPSDGLVATRDADGSRRRSRAFHESQPVPRHRSRLVDDAAGTRPEFPEPSVPVISTHRIGIQT